ncbi:MAG: hypothetical protein WAM72_23590 [Xanthobacteraceae bacterium]
MTSEMGRNNQFALQNLELTHVADGSTSVFGRCPRHFRFALDSGPMTDIERGQFRANSCREQVRQKSVAEVRVIRSPHWRER